MVYNIQQKQQNSKTDVSQVQVLAKQRQEDSKTYVYRSKTDI
jgi:hypothetical protein